MLENGCEICKYNNARKLSQRMAVKYVNVMKGVSSLRTQMLKYTMVKRK